SAASIVGPPIEIDGRVKQSTVPAVAYNPVHDEYLVVWTNYQDQWSHDIWARRVTGKGLALDAPFCVSTFPAEYHESPRVAFNPVTQEYLVAYTRKPEGGYTDVYVRRVRYDGAWISAPVQLSWGGGYHSRPAVAYNPLQSEYVVAWSNYWAAGGQDISAQRVRSDGLALNSTLVVSGPQIAASQPAISYSPLAYGGAGGYLVAYMHQGGDPQTVTIRVKLARADLTLLETTPEVVLTTTNVSTLPAAASGKDGSLVAWSVAAPAPDQVRARRVSSGGTPLGGGIGFDVSGIYTTNISLPAVSLAYGRGYGYLAAWSFDDAWAYEVRGRYVLEGQDAASGQEFIIDGQAASAREPAVACRPNGDCLVAYELEVGGDWDIWARLVRPHRVFLPLVMR
ncbi:MAG: hypothetical protein R6X16_13580, partial [Anaerolineae bacterium]